MTLKDCRGPSSSSTINSVPFRRGVSCGELLFSMVPLSDILVSCCVQLIRSTNPGTCPYYLPNRTEQADFVWQEGSKRVCAKRGVPANPGSPRNWKETPAAVKYEQCRLSRIAGLKSPACHGEFQ